jgi:hypothetical protein
MLFRQSEYVCDAIHPGHPWFYNRQNVYPCLGFESFTTKDDLPDDVEQVHYYVSDRVTTDMIIEHYEEYLNDPQKDGYFNFTVTIQNHGPYEKHYGTLPANFSTDVPLDETQTDLLTQYFTGVIDADEQIGRLKAYAENSDEPIVLVYFGDHLLGFSNGMEFFDLLDYPIDANGTPAEQLAVYETPYFIWQNDKAEALCGNIRTKAAEMELPENGLISSQFLGTTVLEMFADGYESPLHQLNNQLRKELPVCAKNIYVDAAGNYTEYLSAKQQETVKTLKNWQYYKLFDDKNP